MLHGDDGWEESEEAWELGGEEMMIVGTVQQEEDYNWQDACKSWMEQDEEVTVGVHQVGTRQDAAGAKKEAARQPPASQCKKTGVMEVSKKTPEPDDLLLEGEEQEYFLELLMRRASPERPKASQSAEGMKDSGNETASAKSQEKGEAGKRKKRLSRKEA